MDNKQRALDAHKAWGGKIEVISRAPITNPDELSIAYTPGVAQPCLSIAENGDLSYAYTRRSNMVAVITDGSAVLGLGNIGAAAAMPVMEGKCALFKTFANVDAFPLCIGSQDTNEIVRTVELLQTSFGGINLEDISAPRCFEIERRLKEVCDIPVFHDDQHGTAVVTSAALINACKFTNRNLGDIRVVFSGAGAAGTSIARLMARLGVNDIIICDSKGIIDKTRHDLNDEKRAIARETNPHNICGTLSDALIGADVFVGVSAPGILQPEMIHNMSPNPIIFAMANPIPEIMPDEALKAGAAVDANGRSDFPNQINNVLAFPAIFRGALDVRARDINDNMMQAAAHAIADLIPETDIKSNYIIPSAFDERVVPAVSKAVAQAARASGVARL